MSPSVSFEFFPPKTDAGRAQLLDTAIELAKLNPTFMTVTYGAGGSTRAWTMEMAGKIQTSTGIPTAAHLTCVNTTRAGVNDVANELWACGIKHIVALRGDVPREDAPLNYQDFSYYHYANELVGGLLSLHPFEISVAAYPEKHPEASDLATDIEHLRRKCAAGATRAITQFFFDNDDFFRFIDHTTAAGITTPIVPGVLPVANFEKMLSFAKTCQAQVPEWMHEKFASAAPEDAVKIGEEILCDQVGDLAARGVRHIHFYTLNRADLTAAAVKSLRV